MIEYVQRLLLLVISSSLALMPFDCKNSEIDSSAKQGGTVQPLTEHWEKAIPFQQPAEGLTSLSAKECGECHEEIYQEWKASLHAQAWFDPQFQVEWAKDDSLWVCINCHTPLVNQQPFLILGKKDGDYFRPVKQRNPRFDPALRDEGITCAVCHVRDHAVRGPFGDQENAPHAVRKAAEELSEKLCLSCHNVVDVLSPTLVCTFQTGEEWKGSPYAEAGENCITCHMPEIWRPLVEGGPVRATRKHIWIGSGIPKSIQQKGPVEGYVPGLDLRIVSSKKDYRPGEEAYFTALLTNRRAGHFLPTGDPEYFITLDLGLVDGRAKTLLDTTYWIGQKWQWWPKAEKLSDNRLRPLETRAYSFSFVVPESARGLQFMAKVTMHRMTEEVARSAGLAGKYPLKTVTLQQRIAVIRE